MTVQEAVEKLKYIKYIGNGEQEYKKCAESIAIDMAIEALEKQIKLEEVVARLEEMKLIRVEQCHDDYEIEVMTESNFDDAIEIVKRGVSNENS
jgi:hypothetical protein